MNQMKTYKQRIEEFLSNKYYMISVIVIAIIGFGFAITHTTVDIDDLDGDRYLGPGNRMLSAGRFGLNFWAKIFGSGYNDPYHSFTIDLIAVILLIMAAIQFCILFQRVTDNKFSMLECTLFSCLFISYPLINEIWEYNGANLAVCGGYLLAALSVYCMYEVIENINITKKQRIALILFSLFCTTIICSSYESLAAVYVLLVFTVLFFKTFLNSKKQFSFKTIIIQGIKYASILAGGVILRLIIHRILLFVLNIPISTNGATEIFWGTEPLCETVRRVTVVNIYNFIMDSIIYFPKTVVVLCFFGFGLFIIINIIKVKDFRMFFTGLGMMVSLFVLSFFQGTTSPVRTCQTYALFSAIVILLLYDCLKTKKWIGKIAVILIILLSINQATYLSHISTANYMRSENEAYVVNDIGRGLLNEGGKQNVVFVGNYEIPPYILEQVKPKSTPGMIYQKINSYLSKNYKPEELKYVSTNVNSILNWSIIAFDCDGKSLEKLFAFYGYKITAETDRKVIDEAVAFAKQNDIPCYPKNGYIFNKENYTIVRLS